MTKVRLGTEAENVTTGMRGIVIGHIEYLEGTDAWLVQPKMAKDGSVERIVEWSAAYTRYVGEGVHVRPRHHIGFTAEGLDDGKKDRA